MKMHSEVVMMGQVCKKAQLTCKQLAVKFIFAKSWFIGLLTFVVSQENCGVDAKD